MISYDIKYAYIFLFLVVSYLLYFYIGLSKKTQKRRKLIDTNYHKTKPLQIEYIINNDNS